MPVEFQLGWFSSIWLEGAMLLRLDSPVWSTLIARGWVVVSGTSYETEFDCFKGLLE